MNGKNWQMIAGGSYRVLKKDYDNKEKTLTSRPISIQKLFYHQVIINPVYSYFLPVYYS